jgi:RNA recognition motif-containing protein
LFLLLIQLPTKFFIMNIFVAKMSYDTTADSVRDLFEQFGEVESVKIIFDKERGVSKGFGFVEMPNDTEALAGIEALDGTTLDGRQIVVKKADAKPEGGGFRPRPAGGGGPRKFGNGGGGGGPRREGGFKPRGDYDDRPKRY